MEMRLLDSSALPPELWSCEPVLHQGSRRHRTELPGAHSRERLRHRQAPNDDDDDDDDENPLRLCTSKPPLYVAIARPKLQKNKSARDIFSSYQGISSP